jgi:CxxC motif-containing protein (DUF1111 family)
MKRYIQLGLVIFAAASLLPLMQTSAQTTFQTASQAPGATAPQLPFLQEAPTGFDNKTNGYLTQDQMDQVAGTFKETEGVTDGLGPLFNDIGCANCHNNPVTGGGSSVLETRAGRLVNGVFVPHHNGSLIRAHVIPGCSIPLPQPSPGEDVTFRASVGTLGDGFIEAIADDTIKLISMLQPPNMRGIVVNVPVLEAATGTTRVGRFGWKNQHGSLVSFSADAYLNEMGITSSLMPQEAETDPPPDGKLCDTVRDPEDTGMPPDVDQFANFIRSTKAPSRGPIAPLDDLMGTAVFLRIGCATCHVPILITALTGTSINGGAYSVPPALGNKIIHPYSDFLLHDVGVPDPIVQNGGQISYNKVRTTPLWGLRTRTQFMHDGQSKTIQDAIQRHQGQAGNASAAFNNLSSQDKKLLMTFLNSL